MIRPRLGTYFDEIHMRRYANGKALYWSKATILQLIFAIFFKLPSEIKN